MHYEATFKILIRNLTYLELKKYINRFLLKSIINSRSVYQNKIPNKKDILNITYVVSSSNQDIVTVKITNNLDLSELIFMDIIHNIKSYIVNSKELNLLNFRSNIDENEMYESVLRKLPMSSIKKIQRLLSGKPKIGDPGIFKETNNRVRFSYIKLDKDLRKIRMKLMNKATNTLPIEISSAFDMIYFNISSKINELNTFLKKYRK